MSDATSDKKRIVVGFDGSEGAERALEWAIEEAMVRDQPLEVVRSWTPGEFGTASDVETYTRGHLQSEVAAIIQDAPVTWEAITEQGPAAKVLLDRAFDSSMLVVGSRGHGQLGGLVLGSVSMHVTTHPGAAVVVVVRGD